MVTFWLPQVQGLFGFLPVYVEAWELSSDFFSLLSFPMIAWPSRALRQIDLQELAIHGIVANIWGAPETTTGSLLFFLSSFIIPLTVPSRLKVCLGRLVEIELSKAIRCQKQSVKWNNRLAKEAFLNKESQTAFEVCQHHWNKCSFLE